MLLIKLSSSSSFPHLQVEEKSFKIKKKNVSHFTHNEDFASRKDFTQLCCSPNERSQ
jgi:hypothetical protein